MAFAVLSIYDLVYNKDQSGRLLSKITGRGKLLILFAILSVVFNGIRDARLEHKQKVLDNKIATSDSLLRAKQEELLTLQLSTKDTIIGAINATYINSIKASNEALAKYNLVIRDSLKSIVSKLELGALSPQLLIAPQEKERSVVYLSENNSKLNIKFISKAGTSYNISIYYYIIKGIYDKNTQINFGDIEVLDQGVLGVGRGFIPENVESTRYISISPDFLNYNELSVYLRGSFTKDPDGKIIVPYNEAFIFNFKEKSFVTKYEFRYEILDKLLNINDADTILD